MANQRWTKCRGLGDTQRQARKLISGPSPGTNAKFLTFNRAQSRVVTGLLTRHNTLRRHLHLLVLLDRPLCGRCGMRQETSAYILCKCEGLVLLRIAYLGSFSLDIKNYLCFGTSVKLRWDTKGPLLIPRFIGAVGTRNQTLINQSINQSTCPEVRLTQPVQSYVVPNKILIRKLGEATIRLQH